MRTVGDMPCYICGRSNAQKHHVYTRGAWGKKAEVGENIVHLCWMHHMAFHNLGRETAAKLYRMEERVRDAERAVRGKCD